MHDDRASVVCSVLVSGEEYARAIQKFYRKWAEGQSFDLLKNDLYEYYYDQSHFTKEFRKMTGYSPRKFSLEVSNEFGRRPSLR